MTLNLFHCHNLFVFYSLTGFDIVHSLTIKNKLFRDFSIVLFDYKQVYFLKSDLLWEDK